MQQFGASDGKKSIGLLLWCLREELVAVSELRASRDDVVAIMGQTAAQDATCTSTQCPSMQKTV